MDRLGWRPDILTGAVVAAGGFGNPVCHHPGMP